MLSKIQIQSLKGCTIRIHHPVHHLMEVSPFEKVPYPRISMRVKCMDYILSRAYKDVRTYFLNHFLQHKIKIFSPDVYGYIHSTIKMLTSLDNLKSTHKSGRLLSFIGNWLKKTSDPVIQEILKCYWIPILDLESFQVLPHPAISMVQEDAMLVDQ